MAARNRAWNLHQPGRTNQYGKPITLGRRSRQRLPREGLWFVTSSTVNHMPVFQQDEAAEIVLSMLELYRRQHSIMILEYVVMPTHIHLIAVTANKGGTLSSFMRDFKRSTSFELKNSWQRGEGLWESRFDDLLILNEAIFRVKADYIRWNPVKAGLCNQPEEFPHSSSWARVN